MTDLKTSDQPGLISPAHPDYVAPRPVSNPELEYVEPARPADDFTDAQRAWAAKAHAAGKVLVLDRGPREPVKGDPVTRAEIEAEETRIAAAKRERDKWNAEHKEPVAVEMSAVDATHAIGADPERYVIIPRSARVPVTLDERVTAIERHLKLGIYAEPVL